jgi:hypothetical protein
MPLEMLDAFASDSGGVILDTHPDFLYPGTDDVPCASALGMVAIQARFQCGKEDTSIEFLADTLPFQQGELGVIAFA